MTPDRVVSVVPTCLWLKSSHRSQQSVRFEISLRPIQKIRFGTQDKYVVANIRSESISFSVIRGPESNLFQFYWLSPYTHETGYFAGTSNGLHLSPSHLSREVGIETTKAVLDFLFSLIFFFLLRLFLQLSSTSLFLFHHFSFILSSSPYPHFLFSSFCSFSFIS